MTTLGNLTIKEIVNTKGQTYKKLQPDLTGMTDQEIIKLIQENPSIMIRPLLSNGVKLVKGFKEDEYRILI